MHPRSCYIICIGLALFVLTVKSVVAHNYENHMEIDDQLKTPDIRQWKSQPVISPGCPQLCKCQKNATHDIISVDCSSKGLTTVPDLPDTTVDLSLEDNSISNISCESFKLLPNLENLNLAYNEIHHLSPCVFQSQSADLVHLNISYNNMEVLDVKLFKNLFHLENLDLSRNFITHLAFRTFSDLVHLVSLDLSFNYIESIAPDGFKGLYSLKNLSLLNNRLDNYTSFHKDVFQDLGALEMLDVKANLGTIDGAVSALKNVTHLYMQVCNNYKMLGPGFRQLTNLRVLNLNSISLKFWFKTFYKSVSVCSLPKDSSNFFDNIRTENDFELYVSACDITMKGNDTFIFPSTLFTLDLSSNLRMNFGSTNEDWMESLINTRINYLDLSWTWDTYDLHYIEGCFVYLAKTNLKTLVLVGNFIFLAKASDDFPTSVEKLDVSDNYIDFEGLYYAFNHSQLGKIKLKEIRVNDEHQLVQKAKQFSVLTSDASARIVENSNTTNTRFKGTGGSGRWSSETKFPDSVSGNGSQIFGRSLSSGGILNWQGAAVAGSKLPKVFNENKIIFHRNLDEEDPDIQIICLPPDLEAVYANSGIASYDFDSVPHIRIVNNTVLRHVELADNPLKALLGPVENVPSLQYLDISRNQCRNLGVHFFKYMVSLQTLIVKENFIGPSLGSDFNGLTFSTLSDLKTLDVSGNSIKDLSNLVFIHNRNLEVLNLSSNQLSEFQPTLSTIINMSVLDLSGNVLPGLSEQTCEELKLLKSRNKHFVVNLLYNRLLLSCDYLPFLYLVLSTPQIFLRVEDLQFNCINETKFSYKDLAHHFPPLARECLAQRFFILILIIFFVVVGTVTICAVIYHKRWKLRYLYYIGHRRMHIGELVVDYAPVADVFITYDQDDLRWRGFMQQTFLPGLNKRNITYILGETDFPGGDLMAHVTGAVVGTRKTVVLLSVDIFDDHHREYEMNLSIMREMDTRSLKIVPIFVEEVDLSLYPREIELFLRNQWQRCFKYKDTDCFWRRFIDAVKEDN